MTLAPSRLRLIADELEATLQSFFEDVVDDAGEKIVQQITGRLNAQPTCPSIDLYPADPAGTQEEAGFQSVEGAYVFTVRARVNTADHEAAQDVLLDLMDDDGEMSVATALFDDQTLNGRASSVNIAGPTGYRRYIDEGGDRAYLGCEWTVTILPEQS